MTGIVLSASSSHAYYYVSGVVDFTYTSVKTTTGNATTESHSWTDHYGVHFGSSILDPRFLQWNAGVDYSRSHPANAPDQDMISYNLSTSFFPGRMISWSLFNAKTVVNVPSTSNLAGYDIETSHYGGIMTLRLSELKRKSNGMNNYYNNNNYGNNNNNARRGWTLSFPDIILGADHSEAQSFNQSNLLHETRDNASANVLYAVTPSVRLTFDGKTERYENLVSGSGYDTTTLDLVSKIPLDRESDLQLRGRTTDREYDNLAGYAGKDRSWQYEAQLDVEGKRRLAQTYRAQYTRYETSNAETQSKSGTAQIRYAVLPELIFQSSIDYTDTQYVRNATATTPEAQASVTNGSLSLGLHYIKEFKPETLDPFVVRASYDLDSGFSDVNNSETGQQGSGNFYGNKAGIGLFSSGWRFETVSLSYDFMNTRDHSPIHRNSEVQTYRLTAGTSRIPKGRLNASAQYTSSEASTGPAPDTLMLYVPSATNRTRLLQYTANFDYQINQNIDFSSGATRSQTMTSADYTLATIQAPGTPDRISERYYATLTAKYSLTRTMDVRASAGEEWLGMHPGGGDTTVYNATLGLDWRIRKILINADYRWRQDVPETGTRSQQEYFYVRASRPF